MIHNLCEELFWPASVLALPKFINFENFFLIGVDRNVIFKIAMTSYRCENLPLHMANGSA